MTTSAIILAAGQGTRAGVATPKQWRQVAGRRVVDWTLDAFRASPQVKDIVLVLPQDAPDGDFGPDIRTAPGGASRSASVRAGLAALGGDTEKVLIHDVARCCVSQRIIADVVSALDDCDAAAPGIAVTDALWRGADGRVTGTQDRAGLYAAQTPQGFRRAAIVAAHAAFGGDAADDVEVARAAGLDIRIVPGDAGNLKITTPEDFDRARRHLETAMDIRLGNGYDVHRFGPGDHVTLCGVAVPFDRGLDGHSDADVGMHAVTDAIYGALAQGDIGRHFPPSDPQWKGADSAIFLRHAVALAAEAGYRVANVDCTLVCEMPKIGPHAARMQETMAGLMGLRPDQVSVKATTSERLGFTGRGEGIAAIATACLVSS